MSCLVEVKSQAGQKIGPGGLLSRLWDPVVLKDNACPRKKNISKMLIGDNSFNPRWIRGGVSSKQGCFLSIRLFSQNVLSDVYGIQDIVPFQFAAVAVASPSSK